MNPNTSLTRRRSRLAHATASGDLSYQLSDPVPSAQADYPTWPFGQEDPDARAMEGLTLQSMPSLTAAELAAAVHHPLLPQSPPQDLQLLEVRNSLPRIKSLRLPGSGSLAGTPQWSTPQPTIDDLACSLATPTTPRPPGAAFWPDSGSEFSSNDIGTGTLSGDTIDLEKFNLGAHRPGATFFNSDMDATSPWSGNSSMSSVFDGTPNCYSTAAEQQEQHMFGNAAFGHALAAGLDAGLDGSRLPTLEDGYGSSLSGMWSEQGLLQPQSPACQLHVAGQPHEQVACGSVQGSNHRPHSGKGSRLPFGSPLATGSTPLRSSRGASAARLQADSMGFSKGLPPPLHMPYPAAAACSKLSMLHQQAYSGDFDELIPAHVESQLAAAGSPTLKLPPCQTGPRLR